MAFVYLPLITIDDFLEPPATTGPDPFLRRPTLPSTSHHRRAWQRPQAIPLIPADLQIGRQ